ncbi:precorrin-6A reductase [Companilactobacillus sp.]|uniref:precorrin-6A reductase n=1 Tax=Companilactobacillus sp. TaxID=2767905 RepID=UPI002635D3F0|nr:precorrin-6A reductase [Companilactobacillus sp.]
MILMMGGTTESLQIADFLESKNIDFIISVVSQYGADLALKHHDKVQQKAMDQAQLEEFIQDSSIDLILDATHPFAKVASQNAMAVVKKMGLKYIRFERQNVYEDDKNIILLDDLQQVCDALEQTTGNVYLTTGSNTVGDYVDRLGVDRIHVRVLPTTRVIDKLTKIGIPADRVDGMRGPFEKELNIALLKHAHATALVTKESGKQGGINEKIEACQELDIPCYIIRRPQLDYPVVVENLTDLDTKLEELA